MPDVQANGRFSLNDQGQIFWQADATNPLPGGEAGHIAKGESLLAPVAVIQDEALLPAAQDFLAIHIRQVLEGLFTLLQTEGEGALQGAAAQIGQKLFDHLGVVHRGDLEGDIAALDADARKALRSKGVRLGPVLVFVPALVKPAAIRLRALLWAVWNDKPLPISQPADGRVSDVVDGASIDRGFYRMIGYPVFGPRAIRIDMLDRVVTDIYDTAEKGVFEAKHKYAEWFGCGLDDLHAILESMGHRKLRENKTADDNAAEAVADGAEAEAVDAAVATEAEVAADADSVSAVSESETAVDAPAKPVIVAQKFFLKRGKMSERPQSRQRAQRADTARDSRKPKAAFDPNKPQGKRDSARRDDAKRDDKPRRPKGDKRPARDNEAGRVYTFEGKKDAQDDANNPFAILKQLQK